MNTQQFQILNRIYNKYLGRNADESAIVMYLPKLISKQINPSQLIMHISNSEEFRNNHKEAANRAIRAGYDIIYVYAAHDLSILSHFKLPTKPDTRFQINILVLFIPEYFWFPFNARFKLAEFDLYEFDL